MKISRDGREEPNKQAAGESASFANQNAVSISLEERLEQVFFEYAIATFEGEGGLAISEANT